MNIYQQIQKDNIVKYGTEYEKMLDIIINQYSNRTHFIYEIIQNAEDAGATRIEFHLKKDSLEIFHNGRPFDEKDIIGVCGIADGTKKDGTRIGHFGIGFKSVYCYTESPEIYSGNYHFRINKQIFPDEIPGRKGLLANETCMVLPFNLDNVPNDIAYEEIKEALLNKITASSIIMLNSIEVLDIEIDGHKDSISISKMRNMISSTDECDVYALGISTKILNGSRIISVSDEDYLLFSSIDGELCTIAYKVGGADGKTLLPIKNAKVYAYFPTAKEAHQNFYIHAPFDTTPARDNFKEGAEYGKHNNALVECICDLITGALLWLKDSGYLGLSGLKVAFPIYEYENTDILYAIYQNSIDIVSNGIEIIPTNTPGLFKSIDNICEPRYTTIVDIFNDDDLHSLVNYNKYWLTKEIATGEYRELREFFNDNFEIDKLGWEHFLPKLTARFLEQKNITWIENMMSATESYCIRTNNSSHYIDVSNVPLVRNEEKKHICARDENGHLQVYLNNPKIAKYKIHDKFIKSPIINSFLRNALQIPEFNIEQEVIEKVLPQYESKNVNKTIKENIADLKAINDAIPYNPSVVEKVKDYYIVTDGVEWYKPTELNIYSTDVRAGFITFGANNFKYLSGEYFDDTVISITLDEKFFKNIGCNASVSGSYLGEKEYLKLLRKYKGSERSKEIDNKIFSKQYYSPSISELTFCYTGLDSLFDEMNFQKSQNITRFLNSHSDQFDLTHTLYGADDQHFTGKNVDSATEYTLMGLYLSYEKWIYIEGEEEPQRPIDIDRTDIRSEYKHSLKIIDVLPFKTEKSKIEELLKEVTGLEGDDLDITLSMISSPEDLKKITKAYAKSKAKEASRKNNSKGIEELLHEGNKRQLKSDDDEFGYNEVNPMSEKVLQHRTEKLDKEFRESMDHVISAARGLTFARRDSNEEEKLFLKSEYAGYCQICGKHIIKYNGDVYFEAINILKFSKLNEKLASSSKLGWNSLCLCPNCAAEYNFCSKKISDLHDQVMATDVEPDSDNTIDIRIEMPEGNPCRIHYSPRHFLALKEAFKIFTQDE